MTGDVLLHNTLWRQAQRDADGGGYDFHPLFAGVRPAISAADFAICHLETPVAPVGGPYSSYPVFSVPPQIVPALAWTGYDMCTTASNHTLDQGEAGVRRTLDALDDAELAHAGAARSAEEAGRVALVTVQSGNGDVQVAILSYTYGLNGFSPPAGKSWMVGMLDVQDVVRDARAAREAGADLVLVALHWGVEYRHPPTDDQRSTAEALLAVSDVDLVYGHHAHVVQPFEKIGDKWVAYGLGNHVADQRGLDPATREGAIARFTFTETADRSWVTSAVEYAPTYITAGRTLRLVDVGQALDDPDVSGSARATYEQVWDSVSAVVGSLGAMDDGLRPIK